MADYYGHILHLTFLQTHINAYIIKNNNNNNLKLEKQSYDLTMSVTIHNHKARHDGAKMRACQEFLMKIAMIDDDSIICNIVVDEQKKKS